MKIALLAGVVVLISAAYFAQKLGRASQNGAMEASPVENRENVPDFILTDPAGKQKKLSEYRGKVVIVSFWASWCAPCLIELPTFAELEKKYGSRGLEVLPVNVEEGTVGTDFAKDFWAKNKLPFTNFTDPSFTMAQHFEVDVLPSNFVLDKQGRLVFSSFGANDWSASDTKEFIENLLDEPAS
jgi:thiol-disulfide isomerase/thioredoxin